MTKKENYASVDARLSLLNKLHDNRPESNTYRMVMPASMNEVKALRSNAVTNHLHEVLEKKAVVFSVCDQDDDKPLAMFLCKLGDEKDSYMYTMNGRSDSEPLRTYEKECVEYAVKKLMKNARVSQTTFNQTLAAYNTLGCAEVCAM